MKKLSVFVFLIALSIGNAKATGKIILSGNLEETPAQRSIPKPIVASLETDALRIELPARLGTIDITIDDELGNTVYQQSVSTTTAQTVVINLAFWNSGEYTLLLVNAQGKYLQGEFEVL
jgi:hypothetical protein